MRWCGVRFRSTGSESGDRLSRSWCCSCAAVWRLPVLCAVEVEPPKSQKAASWFPVQKPSVCRVGIGLNCGPGRASTKLAGLIRSQGRGACRLAFRAGGACLSKVFSSSLPRTSKFPKEKSSDGSRTGGDPSHLQQNSAVDRRGSTRRGNVSNPSAYAK